MRILNIRAGNHFRAFINTDCLLFKNLNEQVILEFQDYLKNERKIGNTTINPNYAIEMDNQRL